MSNPRGAVHRCMLNAGLLLLVYSIFGQFSSAASSGSGKSCGTLFNDRKPGLNSSPEAQKYFPALINSYFPKNKIVRSYAFDRKVQDLTIDGIRIPEATTTLVLQSLVDRKATPHRTKTVYRTQGSFPYSYGEYVEVTEWGVQGVSGGEFSTGEISDYSAKLEVMPDRRSINVFVGESKLGKPHINVGIPEGLPGVIGYANLTLREIDRQYQHRATYILNFELVLSDSRGGIKVELPLQDSRYFITDAKIEIEPRNQDYSAIPELFPDINTDLAYNVFRRQARLGDVRYLKEFFRRNKSTIMDNTDNRYFKFIGWALEDLHFARTSLESRAFFLSLLPRNHPLITGVYSKDDAFTVFERNYMNLIYGSDKTKIYPFLKALLRKGAPVTKGYFNSDLVRDIKSGKIRERVTDEDLLHMILREPIPNWNG